MSLQTLPGPPPSRTSRCSTSWPTRIVHFGGGHRLAVAEGPQHQQIIWQLVWRGLNKAEIDRLTRFFAQHRGITAFFWTPPGDTKAALFSCREWQQEPLSLHHHILRAKLEHQLHG